MHQFAFAYRHGVRLAAECGSKYAHFINEPVSTHFKRMAAPSSASDQYYYREK
jgi:hypothetical protein